ncbi:Uncharacterised protein [Mycobacteroides abscessus subsp. abscessus]|nr:Uncharacterised protein [Mycobacteroides abscessus subsp. abscessus]
MGADLHSMGVQPSGDADVPVGDTASAGPEGIHTVGQLAELVEQHGVYHYGGYRFEYLGSVDLKEWNAGEPHD